MPTKCENHQENLDRCNCSNTGCERRGTCCECLHAHLAKKQLPGCCFPDDAEKTWDRSFKKFIEVWGDKL
jgi:hypothetical protein